MSVNLKLTIISRRMDILNADLALLNEVEAWNLAQKLPKRKVVIKPRPKKRVDEDSGFHFVAYVPIDGAVWRLDGLQRAPAKIGKLSIQNPRTDADKPQESTKIAGFLWRVTIYLCI